MVWVSVEFAKAGKNEGAREKLRWPLSDQGSLVLARVHATHLVTQPLLNPPKLRQNMKLLLLVALLGVAYVAAECPEACNGHGFCGEYDKPVSRSLTAFYVCRSSRPTRRRVGGGPRGFLCALCGRLVGLVPASGPFCPR